ncbi:MAG: dockerin type I domain-containing protein [Candidatus Poribacteria bacterium]|nr:dockerin type I domain-containing protein [Candidatus Poribacteria bacterium]
MKRFCVLLSVAMYFGFAAISYGEDLQEEAVVEPPMEEPIFTSAGPKIEGPWLWMIAPTGEIWGKAASSGKDWLAEARGGSVTEQQITMNGATAGDPVGAKVWTSGKLAPTGGNNITEAVNAIGLGPGNDIDHHVAYGSISLLSPGEQNTTMYVGSDDAVKVWLNGELVHNNPVPRSASDYQESVPVTLKFGKNILLVAVYEFEGAWSGFFGFENDAAYIPAPTVKVSAAERPPLYWINTETGGTPYQLIGDDVENYVGVPNITSLAIDATNGKIYAAQKTSDHTGIIGRADLDGSNIELVKELNNVPHGIAVDPSNGKLYLTNSRGKVQRFNLDGSNFEWNFIVDLNSPQDIAMDVAGGKIYWTEQTGENTGRVRRADLDGSNVELVKELNNVPHGIAVDSSNGKLYLTNSRGKVQRFNLDGSNFEWNFIVDLNSPQDIAVDVAGGKIYWIEKTGIRRANLDGTNIQDVVTGSGYASIVLGTPIARDDVVTMASPPADINEDGRINVTDLLLVVTALQGSETANPRADVNADGTVTTADLLLVIENLDDPVNASAPMSAETITSLDKAMLETQLNILLAQTDGSLRYQQAIAFLQTLLATTRPNKTRLLANYPNPFNPETWIPYQLTDSSDVQILIYDTKGTVVRHLELGHQPAGYYTSRNRAAYWDGRNTLGERVASGIYFYQLQVDDLSLLRKMIILK